MSEQELVDLVKKELNNDTETSIPQFRGFKTAIKGNRVFAENVGKPVYEYLDTVYFDRIKKYVEETYEQRIKQLEERVSSLEARVK